MNPVVLGVVSIIVMVVLFLLRMPVSFAMAFIGLAGFSVLIGVQPGLGLLARDFFEIFSSYSLTVIPMFVLMGALAFSTGISSRLYKAGYTLFGRFPAGLALSTIAACAGFAAICGSTNATAAAMGKVALPEMRKYGYDNALATGCVAASGSLGILIPPSTILLVYGILTEQSIGKLFIAGVIPGIILASLFGITVFLLCFRNPSIAPAGKSTIWKEKIEGMLGAIETLILFLLVILGLFLGWFSPTQAGAAGAAGVIIIGLVRRNLTWSGFISGVKDAVKISCMVMVIVAGATIFGHFIAVTKIPLILADWVSMLQIPHVAVMAVIILIYLIGGCFMDSLALITLTIPIFYPVVVAMGFDPIWFGVIIVLVTEMGVITPPVGVNVYVIKGIAADVPLETIFKGIFPFLAAIIVAIALLLAFPVIATFLPSFMSY
jgi:tripartite ATP-independent transporter DctM subunit